MASGMTLPLTSRQAIDEPVEPRRGMIFIALGTAIAVRFRDALAGGARRNPSSMTSSGSSHKWRRIGSRCTIRCS